MGKASKLKKIRKLATMLPPIPIQRVMGEAVHGITMIKEGVEKLKDGTAVDPDKMYSKKKLVPAQLNHNKKMKTLYNKMGVGGVNGYIQAVKQWEKEQKAKEASP